jgi:uncharacterized protein (DUF4415 family)
MKNESTGNMPQTNQTDWSKVKHLTDADIVHDADSPATSAADWSQAFTSHSAIELHQEAARRAHPAKEQIAIQYDADVLAYFRATGKGWQTRMNEALKEWLKEHAA